MAVTETAADRRVALSRLQQELERIWSRQAALTALLDEREVVDSVSRVLLRLIRGHEPVRSTDLAVLVGLSRPAVSRRIARLEAEGLVAAARDPDDGRAMLLTVTERGAADLEHSASKGTSITEQMTADFRADELEALASLLLRFNDGAARYYSAKKGVPVEG
jgi:DNA-binding MarR family transcriptional regulator